MTTSISSLTLVPIPATQSAIVEDENGDPILLRNVPVPKVRPGTILVRNLGVALTPADYKMGLTFPKPGAGIGMDFVGRVVRQGGQDGHDFQVGDVVCGAVPGSFLHQPWSGAFATYVLAPANLICRLPAHMLPIDAVSMGTPLLTCSMALWGPLSSLALKGTPSSPAAPEDSRYVLVYGGSSTCGTMAVQLLKLSGHRPIVTCSPKHFNLAKSFGAVQEFDYSGADIGNIIRKYTEGKLRHALDCVTDKASVRCCYEALGRPGGQYASLEHCPDDWKTRNIVNSSFVMAFEAFGIECSLDGPYYRPASTAKHLMATQLHQTYQTCQDLGKIKPHPLEVVGTTFQSILNGLDRLRTGTVSGKRLAVVFPEEDNA